MNQQEFTPESQNEHEQSQQGEEIYKTRQHKRKASNMPKDEHPSAYEEAQAQYSYQAKDTSWSERQQARDTSRSERQQARDTSWSERQQARGTSSSERQWRQQTFWQTPPWARPQQRAGSKKRWGKTFLIALIILCALPILLRLLILLFTLFIVFAVLIFMLLFILLIGFLYFKSQRQHWWHR